MSTHQANEKETTLQEVGEAETQPYHKPHHWEGVPHLGGNSKSRRESEGVEPYMRHANFQDLHLRDKPPKCLALKGHGAFIHKTPIGVRWTPPSQGPL